MLLLANLFPHVIFVSSYRSGYRSESKRKSLPYIKLSFNKLKELALVKPS